MKTKKQKLPMNFPASIRSERGSALVGTLVAIGIISIVVAITSQAFKQSMDAHTRIVREGEFEDLRRMVRLVMSCDKTFPTSGCPGSFVIKKKNGSPIASMSGGKYLIGEYTLSATCASSGGGERTISVVAERKGQSQNLFTTVPLVCPAPR